MCLVLNVPVPDNKKKGKKGAEPEAAKERGDEPREAKKARTEDVKHVSAEKARKVDDKDEEANPFDEMDDEIPPGSDGKGFEDAVEEQDTDEEVEEKALENMEAMLGGSDEEEEASVGEDLKAKYQALVGEVGDDADSADDESNSDEEEDDADDNDEDLEQEGDDNDDDDEAMDSDRERRINAANVSLSPSPPPSRKKKEARAKKPTGKSGQTTFLPSLMGGYLSNSESEASDIDVAPPKKRLGQKQRQAIWEKKYGSKANHVKKQAQQQKVRDKGWDMRKGAIDPEDGRAGNKPWKKGVSNPLGRQDRGEQRSHFTVEKKPPHKKDNEGPLHPSWEARKKAKEAQTAAAFQGTKITF